MKSLSPVQLFVALWTIAPSGSSIRGIFPGKKTGGGCRFLLQGIFPTQGSNSGLLHCRPISLPTEPPVNPGGNGGSVSNNRTVSEV